MKIRLLGTGAAEGIPAFCASTRVSNYARQAGGKEVRTRSAALIDGVLKIDLPPDTLMQMHRDGVDARDWSALIFTHSHDDHFAPAEIQYGLYPFNDQTTLYFSIYANATIIDELRARYPAWPMEFVVSRSFEPFQHGDYTVTPIKANHVVEEDSHNLIFEKGGKKLLYATDTGIWHEETWEFLQGVALDLLVLECTEGFAPSDYFGHLSAADFDRVVDRLRRQGSLDQESVICTTHHSHNGDATHAELESYFGPKGILVGFDGREIEIS